MGEAADLELVLVSATHGGGMANAAEAEPLLTTEDFTAIEVEPSESRAEHFNLRFTLTPLGAFRLAEASKEHAGRMLVLRSHGRTFNTLQLEGFFTGRQVAWPVQLPQEMTEAWAQHILGRAALAPLDG
jgi:hypothetical protein